MSLDTPSRDDVLAMLDWYAAMGVDVAVDETAHDRFAESAVAEEARQAARAATTDQTAAPSGQSARPAPGSAPRLATSRDTSRPASGEVASQGLDEAARSAREMAGACATLEELRAALDAFDGCGLKRTASRLVFADGNPAARLMIVGEAPGAEEDRAGLPFVGQQGRLLDAMLASIGLDRTSVYMSNVVPWRPPGNRPPTPQELAICLPFTLRQIALADPDVILCLGGASAQTLLGLKDSIMRARGRWFDFAIEGKDGARKTIPAMPMLRPADLLQSPSAKRHAWRDLREVKKALAAKG